MQPSEAEDFELARALVLRYGWNSTCYQILNPGIERWLSSNSEAAIGYVRSGKFAVVAGAPICGRNELESVISEWESFCQDQSLVPTYFGAEDRLQRYFSHLSESRIALLGSQPEWSPREFESTLSETPSLRAQIVRAKNRGVTVRRLSAEEAHQNPKLAEIIKLWLGNKGFPPLHFLVESDTLGETRDRLFFLAEVAGKPVGVLTLCPVPARNGWLTEQFVRAPSAPNGVIEHLLAEGARHLARQGFEYLTMGIVPLGETRFSRNHLVLNAGAIWTRAHMNRFYNFQGLYEFKAKFGPTKWSPVVLISPHQDVGFAQIFSIVRAFTVVHPGLAFMRALARAFRSEIDRIAENLKAP